MLPGKKLSEIRYLYLRKSMTRKLLIKIVKLTEGEDKQFVLTRPSVIQWLYIPINRYASFGWWNKIQTLQKRIFF